MAKQHKTQGPGTFSPLCPRVPPKLSGCQMPCLPWITSMSPWFTWNMSMPMHHINMHKINIVYSMTCLEGRNQRIPSYNTNLKENTNCGILENPPLLFRLVMSGDIKFLRLHRFCGWRLQRDLRELRWDDRLKGWFFPKHLCRRERAVDIETRLARVINIHQLVVFIS